MTKNQKIIFFMLLFLVAFVSVDALAFGGGGSGTSGVQAPEMFKELAKRTGKFAEGLRRFAMILSAFGIVMFTFLAICGKINFKHLGYIFMCLFFLSGVGAMIVYIKGGNKDLTYEFKDTYTKALTAKGNLPRRSGL